MGLPGYVFRGHGGDVAIHVSGIRVPDLLSISRDSGIHHHDLPSSPWGHDPSHLGVLYPKRWMEDVTDWHYNCPHVLVSDDHTQSGRIPDWSRWDICHPADVRHTRPDWGDHLPSFGLQCSSTWQRKSPPKTLRRAISLGVRRPTIPALAGLFISSWKPVLSAPFLQVHIRVLLPIQVRVFWVFSHDLSSLHPMASYRGLSSLLLRGTA